MGMPDLLTDEQKIMDDLKINFRNIINAKKFILDSIKVADENEATNPLNEFNEWFTRHLFLSYENIKER